MDQRPPSIPSTLPNTIQQSGTRIILRCILACNIALALSSGGFWFIAFQQNLIWRADFSAFYTGWFMAREGMGSNLYDLSAQTITQRTILDGRSFADDLLPYINPPHLTLPFVPLAWLPLSTAYGVWAIIQIALIMLCIYLLLAITAEIPRPLVIQGIVAFLAFPPLAGTLLRGTFSLLLLAALLLTYRALEQGRERTAGLWLILLSLKPQLLLAPGALLVGTRRWSAILYLSIGGFILSIGATAVFGWSIWSAYLRLLAEINTYFGQNGIHPAHMPNLRGLLTNVLGAERAGWINTLSTIVFILGGLGLMCLWWRTTTFTSPTAALRFALSITVGLGLSPHLYSHDALLLVLPLVLLARHLYLYSSWRAYALCVLLIPLLWFAVELLGGTFSLIVLIICIGYMTWHMLRLYSTDTSVVS